MAKTAYKGHMKSGRHSYKKVDGNEVYPVFYHGCQVGHGNYMAGVILGEMQRDKNGKPIPYKLIQAR